MKKNEIGKNNETGLTTDKVNQAAKIRALI